MIVVITGTSRGIGQYLAQYYLDKGHIVIGCNRSASAIMHEKYKHYCLDIENEESLISFASAVRKEYGHIDVLINNAGIASMNHFMLTPVSTAKKIMNVNFFAPFILIRSFISCLKKSAHPRVINFSTIAVPLHLEGELAYVASKASIEELTKILAKELSAFKITVNAVGPVPIQTDLIAKVSEKKLEDLLSKQAIKRFGTFPDISNVLDFYINPQSDFITGQIIYLGGVNK